MDGIIKIKEEPSESLNVNENVEIKTENAIYSIIEVREEKSEFPSEFFCRSEEAIRVKQENAVKVKPEEFDDPLE
jgi:hypothetical protein